MKTRTLLGLAATMVLPLVWVRAQAPMSQPPPPPAQGPGQTQAPVNLSPNAAEVVRLAESGVGEDVILAYIHNSQAPFNLGAEDILYLKDVGVSSPVLTAMLTRDTELRNQVPAPAPTYDQRLYAPAPAPVQTAAAPLETPPPPAQPPPASAPVYVANPPPDVSYFYSDLAPYGSWVELSGVGWCWQPRVVVVNRAWTPYCDGGHWVYSDAGWYWQSDYSWGWAAFHYGRWHLHPSCGWVWLPDRVWGPAWVTWRTTGDYCGWAPLPPHATFDMHLGYCFNGVHVGLDFDFGLHADCFTFVALGNFHQHDYGHYRLHAAEVRNIYSHTTVINNYVVNNNVIVNRGLPVERVSAATHTQFHQMTIREAPPSHNGVVGSPAAAKGVIYRPRLTEPAKPAPMVAQRIDSQHPVVQHTAITPVRTDAHSLPSNGSTVRGTRVPAVSPRPGQAPSANLTGRPVSQNANTLPQSYSLQKGRTTVPNTTAHNPGQASSYSQNSPVPGGNQQTASPSVSPTTRQVQEARSANTYQSEKGTYPSSSTGPKTSQSAGSQNSNTYNNRGYYQGAQGRQTPPSSRQAPTSEGNAPRSEPKKNNPER